MVPPLTMPIKYHKIYDLQSRLNFVRLKWKPIGGESSLQRGRHINDFTAKCVQRF